MKSVHELSAEEFIELRERYIIEFDLDEDRISDEEVRQYYEDTYFVEEDFWCNLVEDEEELNYYEVYDELTNKNLFIEAHTYEQAVELSEHINFDDYENNDRVDLISNKFICNCCGGFFPREEMDFDVDDDQDLCKTCNYQSYNEAPYGQD
jgi:hypothetical protein